MTETSDTWVDWNSPATRWLVAVTEFEMEITDARPVVARSLDWLVDTELPDSMIALADAGAWPRRDDVHGLLEDVYESWGVSTPSFEDHRWIFQLHSIRPHQSPAERRLSCRRLCSFSYGNEELESRFVRIIVFRADLDDHVAVDETLREIYQEFDRLRPALTEDFLGHFRNRSRAPWIPTLLTGHAGPAQRRRRLRSGWAAGAFPARPRELRAVRPRTIPMKSSMSPSSSCPVSQARPIRVGSASVTGR